MEVLFEFRGEGRKKERKKRKKLGFVESNSDYILCD